jgi:hypothetical protein
MATAARAMALVVLGLEGTRGTSNAAKTKRSLQYCALIRMELLVRYYRLRTKASYRATEERPIGHSCGPCYAQAISA